MATRRISSIKTVLVTTSGSSTSFTVVKPGKCKAIKGIIISGKLTGNPMIVNRHYFGAVVYVAQTFNSAFVTALNTAQITSRVGTVAVAAGAGASIFYARPARIPGYPNFQIAGLPVAFTIVAQANVVDPTTGYVELYNIFQSSANGQGAVSLYIS